MKSEPETFFESFILLLSTSVLFSIFFLTAPVFSDVHGLLVTNEISIYSRSGLVIALLFISVVLCVLQGSILMDWAPILTTPMMAILWITTFFYIWADTIFALSELSQSYRFRWALAIAVAFISLFFYLLRHFGFGEGRAREIEAWRLSAVHFWIWGWMGFYFMLSILLVFNSFHYSVPHFLMAFGAFVICFFYYLLSLFLRKTSGKEVMTYSWVFRILFCFWLAYLVLAWVGYKWLL